MTELGCPGDDPVELTVLPIRVELGRSGDFGSLLRHVSREVVEAFRHRRPLGALPRSNGALQPGAPLPHVLAFNYVGAGFGGGLEPVPGLLLERVSLNRTRTRAADTEWYGCELGLQLGLDTRGALVGTVLARERSHGRAEAEALASAYRRLVREMAT